MEEDCEIWECLVERHNRLVRDRACGEYLLGLQRLNLLSLSPAPLTKINWKLSELTTWRLTEAKGIADDCVFFRQTAQRMFPVSVNLRSDTELDFSVLPDLFHDIYGHVPYLLTPRGALLHRMFGELARLKNYDPVLVQRLATLFWFTFEAGLIWEDGVLKVLGAAIVTSPEEMRNIDESDCQIQKFDLDRVLETSYQPRALQNRYFVLSSIGEISDAMKKIFRSTGK